MAKRCRLTALYIIKQGAIHSNMNISERNLVAEILESMGTATYIELQGKGIPYGYPIQIMSDFTKRILHVKLLANFKKLSIGLALRTLILPRTTFLFNCRASLYDWQMSG